MRITTTHLAVAAAVLTVTATLTGCGSDDPKAVPAPSAAPTSASSSSSTESRTGDVTKIAAGDGNFDPCTALTVDDVVAGKYIRFDDLARFPATMRADIVGDRSSDDRNGTVTCTFSVKGQYPGVTLGVPLSSEQSDLKALASDSLGGTPKDVKVGSDKGVISESEKRSTIAVQHGENQFWLSWKAMNATLETMDKETITTDQMIQLAAKVTAKMPTKASLKRIALPDECKRLDAAAIVGKVAVARGSVNDDNINCAFSGPKGILNINADQQISDRYQQGSIDVTRERPDSFPEVTPPIGADTVVFADGRYNREEGGFAYDGFLNGCCEVKFKFTPRDDRKDNRSADLDKDERKLLTTQFDTLRKWAF